MIFFLLLMCGYVRDERWGVCGWECGEGGEWGEGEWERGVW